VASQDTKELVGMGKGRKAMLKGFANPLAIFRDVEGAIILGRVIILKLSFFSHPTLFTFYLLLLGLEN